MLFLVASHDAQLASVYVSMLSGIRLFCVCIFGRRLCREYVNIVVVQTDVNVVDVIACSLVNDAVAL